MSFSKMNGVAWASIVKRSGKARTAFAKALGLNKPSSQTGIKTNNLVMHLDAGNSSSYSGSGTDWLDLTSNGVDAVLVNGPTYSSTEGGGSFYFDGVNDHYKIPYEDAAPIRIGEDSPEVNFVGYNIYSTPNRTYGDVDTDGGMTIHGWCKLHSTSPTKHLGLFNNNTTIASTNNGNNYLYYQGVEVIYVADGRILFYVFSGDGHNSSSNRLLVTSTAAFHTPTRGDWVNICCVLNDDAGSSNTFDGEIYLNGVKATGSYIGSPGNGRGRGLGYRMKRSATQTDKYNAGGMLRRNRYETGYIAEVAVYNEALSASDVLANFNATKSRYGY